MLSARWWTLVVWALAAAGALFWGLKLFVKAPAAPSHTQMADAGGLARGDLTRLLGADAAPELPAQPAEPGADARFQLIGVVSPRSPQSAREGVALIAVDGKPPRAYRVGAVIEGDNVLQSVHARGATLGPRNGAALVALNLAPPAPAATGVPVPLGAGAPAPVMPGMPNTRSAQPVPPPMAQPPVPQAMPPQPMPQTMAQPTPMRRSPPPAPSVVDPASPANLAPSQPMDANQTR